MARNLRLVLRISRIKNDDGKNYSVFGGSRQKEELRLKERVESIILDSLEWFKTFVGIETDERNFAVEQVKISYNIRDKKQETVIVDAVVPARFGSVPASVIRQAVKQMYADDAADTWMEGDIRLDNMGDEDHIDDDGSELFLKAKSMSLHRQQITSEHSDWSAYCEKQEKKFIKFWRVSVSGANWMVEWGKRGTDRPQSVSHNEKSSQLAMQKAMNLLKKKIASGYELLGR